MKRVLLVVVGAVLLTALPGHGDEDKKVQALMRRKLEQAQQVLAGIALADYPKIARHAEELILVSKEAEWKVLKTPRYEVFSNDFRRNAEALIKSAKERDLDDAVTAYVDMTRTCVKCHKHVREVRMVRAD
jgi:hypothetical protein